AADPEHLVLAQLPAAIDGDRGDAKSGGIGDRVAGVAQGRGKLLKMAAHDDAKPGAAEQDQHGGGDAGTGRKVALEQRDQPMRRLLALSPRAARRPAPAEPFAQQYDRANGGGFQVSLGPQRSQRSSEASSTIHCTSSSNVARKRLRVLAQMTLGHAGLGAGLKAGGHLFP